MSKSSIHGRFFDLQVGSSPTANGPRLIMVGKKGPAFDAPAAPKCSDCRDFERAVTRTGVAVCGNPIHAEDKPPLPKREPGGTNPPKPRAARLRSALLVG